MPQIKIISTPPGNYAPESIREEWVGVTMQVAAEEYQQIGRDNPFSDNYGGYVVSGPQAILALVLAGKETAANFWQNPPSPTFLVFGKEYCEVV